MDKRLTCIYKLIDPNTRGVADIGTDHGYIPVALAESGFNGYLYAADINAGPLESAKKNAALSGVSEKIYFQLANGLDKCPEDKIGTIVIAGMGGDTITGILDRAEWCYKPPYQLILQPMTHVNVLRYWLINNGFDIVAEKLVTESRRLYQVLKAVPGKSGKYTDAELYVGKYTGQPVNLYSEIISQYAKRFQISVDGMKSGSAQVAIAYKTAVLKQLKELQEIYDCQ